MFSVIEFSRNVQRSVCLVMSAVIVATSLSLGAYGAQTAIEEASYSVTVHY